MIVSAPAKINLTLEVTGIEPNGYHTLDTVFTWLELEDTLEMERSGATTLTITSGGADTGMVTAGEENLVLRALRALETHLGRTLPTDLRLTKRIPAGGGLGGGSADAAAALFGLNILHGLRLDQNQLLALARPLGADVAFGLVGGTARGTGYGDRLESLEPAHDLLAQTVVLVFPPFACPTPKVYALWDESPSHVARGASDRFLSARTRTERLSRVTNDLEEPAFRFQPRLRELKEKMVRLGLEGVCLSGSGSTLFGFLPPGLEVEAVRQEFTREGVEVVSTKLKESTRFGLVS